MTRFCAQVSTVILVIALLYSQKCDSLTEDAFIANVYNKVRDVNRNFPDQTDKRTPLKWKQEHGLGLDRFRHRVTVQDLLRKLKISDNPTIPIFNTPLRRHRVYPRRLVRQAYPEYKPSLYPHLPTPATSYPQPYSNYPQSNRPNYTPSYNPQWQPTNVQNYSQPGYPGYAPGSNGFNPGNQNPYNPGYAPYNPRPSAPVDPNLHNNPTFGPGHRYPNALPSNFSNYGPQNPQGYQPYPGASTIHNRPNPGYPPSHGVPNNTFTYNPSQRPPYHPSGNSSTSPYQPYYPPHPTTQRQPVLFYNTTTQRTPYNYPGSYPGYPSRPPPSGPYNQGPNYPNHNPGFGPTPLNSTGFAGTHQNGAYNASYNGYRPNTNYNINYPSGPNVNNTNSYHTNQGQAYPGYNNFPRPNNTNQGVGNYGNTDSAYPYNSNQGTYNPTNGQLPGFNPQNQYNGTSTYRLADHYTPNIPNQPPRKDNFGQSNPYYQSNASQDPTRVAPDRFSY